MAYCIRDRGIYEEGNGHRPCDDNISAIEQLQGIIEEYFTKKETEAQLLSFSSGDELLNQFPKIDILFLDIDMPGRDGIQTGEEIRKRDSQCRIIMATCMEKRLGNTIIKFLDTQEEII